MKKFITFMLAAVMVISMIPAGVSAAVQSKQMLVLGDSITTGYGLYDYAEGSPYLCESYANIIARALGLEGGKTYINKAVNGDTSSDLLALMPSLEADLKKSDMIIITIGGNDLLQAVPLVASAMSGKNVTGLEQAANILMAATTDQYAALMQNADFQAKITAVLTKYATNLQGIAEKIKAAAPNAKVMFLKQYNPMKNVIGFADFGNFADSLIGNINTSMETVCAASGFEALDVPSVINVNAAGLTNMLDFDIHPNAKGHVEIAKFLASHLGVELDITEETTGEGGHSFTELCFDDKGHWYECDCGVRDEREDHEIDDNGDCKVCDYHIELNNNTVQTEAATEPEGTGEDTAGAEKKGCASSLAGASVLIVCACAFVMTKKKFN